MNQSQEPQKNGKNQKSELDLETIKAIVAQKNQELQLEAQKLRLEEKRLEQNGKLAEKSLEHNSKLIQKYPSEQRKTILTVGGIASFILILFFLFILYCISQGKTEFADKFLNWISHIAGIAAGFFVGRFSNKKKRSADSPQGPEDAEIIE
jgi:Fe2+ transport system protein B